MKCIEEFQDDHLIINKYINDIQENSKSIMSSIKSYNFYLEFIDRFINSYHIENENLLLSHYAKNAELNYQELLKSRKALVQENKDIVKGLKNSLENFNSPKTNKYLFKNLLKILENLKTCINQEKKLIQLAESLSLPADLDEEILESIDKNSKELNGFF